MSKQPALLNSTKRRLHWRELLLGVVEPTWAELERRRILLLLYYTSVEPSPHYLCGGRGRNWFVAGIKELRLRLGGRWFAFSFYPLPHGLSFTEMSKKMQIDLTPVIRCGSALVSTTRSEPDTAAV